jgi:hypothetical protein
VSFYSRGGKDVDIVVVSCYFRVEDDVVDVDVSSNLRVEKMLMLILMCPLTLGWRRC